ncbi:hypothetical protein AAFF_G00280950 [Aldrovandia affinis]|uniref:Uncharacterized protein n=1 Tax=Aldrovandia affinis TaxID=143900 RepID=A0AAD7W1W0_9TELE|nr:hypothetical protein AAFF_G00280950 [Aldrovandia affinis]
MSRLPIDHPEVHQQFMHGGFSVQLGSQNPYGRIPVDQTIEETVNRDTQTAGGTKGFKGNRLLWRYVARDVLDAHKIGMEAYEGFKRDRLEDEKPKTQFHDKMTKKRLKMFSDIRKKPSASNPNKVILQADRKLFAHMVLVAESRHLQMSDVLSHSLGHCHGHSPMEMGH